MRNLRGRFIIFLVSIILISGCEKDSKEQETVNITERVSYEAYSKNPLVTFILDPKDKTSINYKENIHKTLNYSKIPFTAIQLDEFNSKPAFGANNRIVILTNPDDLNKQAFKQILEFLEIGGMVLLPTLSSGEQFNFLAGVRFDGVQQIDTKATGYLAPNYILPNFKNKAFKKATLLNGLNRESFSADIKVLATANSDTNYPAILQNDLGNGKVILMNTSQAFEKRDRGLLFSILLHGLEGIPYSVANTTSIFLDDFPAPLYNMAMEPVHTEMSVTQANFYTDHWWPDMLNLAKEQGLIYSGYVCFDYRNQTTPPFTFEEWESSKKRESGKIVIASDWLMNQMKNSDHELAFHGYNHASLVENDWPNYDFMVLGLEAAKKRWQIRNYGKLPVSYVPPSNNIDSLGFAALQQVFPSIKYNASLYLGNFEDGGSREFDPEPFNTHFYNFPRITSGYTMDVANQYNQQNLYLYTGIWSHFIHADDIYQIPSSFEEQEPPYEYRNQEQLGWKISENGSLGLYPRFEHYIKQTKKLFPLMRFLAVKNAAEITEAWRNASYSYSFDKQKIKVNTSKENENWWFLYVNVQNKTLIEEYFNSGKFEFSKTNLHTGNLYMLKSETGQVTIPYFPKNTSALKVSLAEQFENYVNLEETPADNSITEKINGLKQSLTSSNSFSKNKWLELARYLGWQNRQAEIWPLLKIRYEQSNRDQRYVELASMLVKGSDYPDMQTRKFWMAEKVAVSEDPQVKLDYIGYFGNDNGVKLNSAEFKQLIASHNSENVRNYIEMFLKEYPDGAANYFTESSCSNHHNSAETISWFYADRQNYKEAIAWAGCAETIDAETIDQWYLKAGNEAEIKQRGYPLYMNWLLSNSPAKATQQLINIEACNDDLKSLATEIAYAFGNQGSYRMALAWSECSADLPVLTRMYWLAQLSKTQEIEDLYAQISPENEQFEEIQEFLVSYYISEADFIKAWKIADSMTASAKKTEFRKQFNKDVVFIDSDKQKQLLEENPDLFESKVSALLEKNIRTTESDFIQLNGNMVADRLDPNYYETKIGYGLRDRSYNTHIFSLVQTKAYEVPVAQIDPNNIDRSLYGLDYQFLTAIKPGKFNFTAGARLEMDQEENLFYHIRAGASISKDSLYSSASVFRRPALTGGAYGLEIYQSQLNIYEELRINETFRTTLYLEGNHYDDDGTVDATAAFAFYGKIYRNGRSAISAYTEVAGLLGNNDKSSGYPYWTLKERLYGGFGAGYTFGNLNKDINLSLDAAYFLDTFSDNFQRYRGSFSYPFDDKLYFTGRLEFYTLKNFYSNNFGVGLRYYLD